MKKVLFSLVLVVLMSYPAYSGQLMLEYGYQGNFGVYDIADTATAYYSGERFNKLKVGYAEAIEIIDKNPGPTSIRVKETHYNPNGTVMYEGFLVFRFGFGGGTLVKEELIKGQKRNSLFSRWPAGR